MKKNINALDNSEGNHSQKINTIIKKTENSVKKAFNSIGVAAQSVASFSSTAAKAITIGTAASLMLACMEPDRPGVQTGERGDSTPPNIRIIIPDSTNKYTIDIVINPHQNS